MIVNEWTAVKLMTHDLFEMMMFLKTVYLLLSVEGISSFVVSPPIANTRYHDKSISLFGLLDEINSDDYNLMDTSNDSSGGINDDFEVLLGDLVFSTNDPRIDIMNNFDRATNDDFIAWMDKKAENSDDPNERLAMKDLNEMIVDIKRKVELSKMAEERAAREAEEEQEKMSVEAEKEAEAGRKMSNADILRKAAKISEVDVGEGADSVAEKKSFFDQELTPEIRMSYEDSLKKLLPPYKAGETPISVVAANYDKFDAQFVKVLTERSANGDEDAASLLAALGEEQSKRISVATETLKGILALGERMKMEGAVVRLAREGKIDEPFLLLLEANESQARDAGAMGPAELMKKLRLRAAEEKDKLVSSKEIRLIRKLLRAEDSIEREKLLEDAFTPKEFLLVAGTPENAMKAIDGEVPEAEKPMPDVPPPDFINACKAVLLNFGNLHYDGERGDLASRIKQIASEAEVVATRIYGQGMTARDQQDRAWKDQTTSIFDLERMELEAQASGDHAPWTNPEQGEDMFLPGFDSQGKMQVGGD
ncbi:unnamed protein product [Cylindrotheca closterium]|uniref:Uncharacterized protein n=1 Tax=Cylindrotheca closterium TaxID=2856 RepID=A0AAD2G0P8_9STRA|nr:unnamed protein product [Cylindrotheca closterium]